MRRILALLLLITTTGTFTFAKDKARFATIFSDNLVLQQQCKVNLWGYANPNEKLSLNCSWMDSDMQIIANADGKWIVSVTTPPGGLKSESVTLCDGSGVVSTLSNVLIGEVWLCSGQSNMEMILMSQPQWNLIVEHSDEEIAQANNPYIRFVNVQRKESFAPVEEVMSYGWKVCNPNDVKWLSAVGYFYAKELFKTLNVPVGLIVSAYGGSPVQSWIPVNVASAKCLYEKEQTKRNIEIEASKQTEAEYIKSMSEWLADAEKKGSQGEAVSLTLPVNIEKAPVGNHMGEVSFSKEIEVSASEDLHFNLGTMDDFGQVYFNGEKVWEELRNSKSYSQVQFVIPADKVKAGKNLLEARVLNVLWGGGLTGPEMFFTVGSKTDKISLKGEWQYKKIFDLSKVNAIPREGKPLYSTLSALYNGMIYPIVNYGIKGCLFYQGEENVGDARRYSEMFTDMILSWRKVFNKDIPFYYVQIAPYGYGGGQFYKAAELREAQALIEKTVPNTGMVSTIDIGNPDNIHPAKKMEVGVRLANIALAKTYKKNVAYKFPVLDKVKCKGNLLEMTFTNVYDSLIDKGNSHEFEISSDGISYTAAKVKITGNKIIIKIDGTSKPRFVRYCWGDASIGTIYNSKGLPLSSFRKEVSNQVSQNNNHL